MSLWLIVATVSAEILPVEIYTSADGLSYEGVRRIRLSQKGFTTFNTAGGLEISFIKLFNLRRANFMS
jgi:hypothetical protein